ncbi:glycosyltransferase family protein [Neobacillus sp. PS3-40]|uniref:glycosyltransferase family protein n=1 Tax=Neobacillus sp. PS3-40 TaxID=3070679 RepID=UPI0027E0CA49|nr:glycosyltransferase family protein [Neobacillus sp. PS3-40]WML46079.1 glycosyltransferase family protein [Neobacillus sp. PS3-40]
MKVIAIIQARMGSTRLPGKILKEVLGKPLLEYQIEQVRNSKQIDEIVIATTTKDTEQPIIDLCGRLLVPYYRGSEEDVLSRYFEAAQQSHAEIIVRLTSDCPLIDPNVIDEVISHYIKNFPIYDYVSNTIERSYPRGLDVEVFSMQALEQSFKKAKDTVCREHVTPYIYQHTNLFNLGYVKNDLDLSKYRLTVDTEEDFKLVDQLIKELLKRDNKYFTLRDIIDVMQENPEWLFINSHIEQKKLNEK